MSLVAVLFLLLLFDRASTAYVVRRWGFKHEINPLFRYLYEKGSRRHMLIVDVAVMTLVMVAAYSAKDFAFGFVLCFAFVGVNNAVVIGRLLWWDARARRTAKAAPGSESGQAGRTAAL